MYFLIKSLLELTSTKTQARIFNKLYKRELFRSLRLLEQRGIKIDTVYDVGAHKGAWTKALKSEFPDAQVTMFEANESNRPFLEQVGSPFYVSVLAGKSGTVQFFSTGSTGDSIFRERTKHYTKVESASIEAQRLDDIVSKENLSLPTLIKIDTQGSELEILKGAQNVLKSAKMVYTETPILNLNAGAPSIQEYLDTFEQAGLFPHKICEVHSGTGLLLQIDILFVRKDILIDAFPAVSDSFDGYLF